MGTKGTDEEVTIHEYTISDASDGLVMTPARRWTGSPPLRTGPCRDGVTSFAWEDDGALSYVAFNSSHLISDPILTML